MISSALSRHFGPLVRKRVNNTTTLLLILLPTLFVNVQGEITVKNRNNSTVAVFFDIQLGYSSTIPPDGVIGRLVSSEPEDGCSPIKSPPNRTDPNSLWFVLVRRFPCSFRIKINNAVTAGYDGIIIYNAEVPPKNSSYSSPPPTLNHGNSSHFIAFASDGIPAVLISNEDGTALKNHYLYEKDYFVLITPEFEQNMLTYLLPFAIIVGICLLILIIFRIMKCVRDQQHQRRNRLSSKHLKKLTITKYHKGDHYDTCSICLEDYVEGEKVRELPCGHIYHLKCIDPWLTKNRRVCPVCKAKVRLPGVPESSDSEAENENANERTPLVEPQRNRPTGRTRGARGTRTRTSRTTTTATTATTANSTPQNYQSVSDQAFVRELVFSLFRERDPETENAETDERTSRPSHRSGGRRHRHHPRSNSNPNNTNTNQEGNTHGHESQRTLQPNHERQLLIHANFDPAEPSTSTSYSSHHQHNERRDHINFNIETDAAATSTATVDHGHESSVVEAVIEVEPHAICDHHEFTSIDHTIDV